MARIRTIKVVAGNSAPPQLHTLKRDGTPIDVTGCDVDLIIVKGGVVTNADHQACVLSVPVNGVVQYTPETTDWPTAGNYKADVKITYPNGSFEILYDELKFKARRPLSDD